MLPCRAGCDRAGTAAIVSPAVPGSEGQVVAYGALAIALMALAYVGVPVAATAAIVRVSNGCGRNGAA